jgi:hypothetical protein
MKQLGSYFFSADRSLFVTEFSEDTDILTEALPGDQYVSIDGKKTYFDISPSSGGNGTYFWE